MGTTYYCDLCMEETKLQRELGTVIVEKNNNPSPHIIDCEFEICRKCCKKFFKPVKEMRSTIVIDVIGGE